jgi:hypothetical protein
MARWPSIAPSKAERGFRREDCGQCRNGLGFGEKKTFDPQCAGCAEKVRLGLRTGLEPAPKTGGPMGEKISRASYDWLVARRARAEAKKKKLQWPSAKERT